MLNNLSTTDIIVIAVVLLILFGGKKLPELAKGLGQASREFRKSFSDGEKEEKKEE